MYQVWTKADYEEGWKLTECSDLAAVEAIITANFGKDNRVKVSVPVEFDARIAVKIHAPKEPAQEKPVPPAPEPEREEEPPVETTQSETKPDKGTGGKSHRQVR